MRSRPWIVLLAAAALLGGCGDDPTLGAESADDLRGQVAAVREAAEAGDRAGALEALDGLEADVKDLEAGGSLAEADAAALRRGIGRARRRAREELQTAAPEPEPTEAPTEEPTPEPTPEETPTATATPEAEPPPEDDAEGEGEGNGNGKAKGKAKKGKD